MVESISKTRVAVGEVEAIVAAAFGPDVSLRAVTECDEGWFNAVHRLDLSDDTSCILKIAPPPQVRVLRYEHDIITTEVDALRLVRARTAVPVPDVLAWDDSCTILRSPYFVMERCPGVLLSELRSTFDDATQRSIDAQIARHVAAINAIPAETFGRPDRAAPHDTTWSAAFGRLVADLLADAADAEVTLPIGADDVQALVAAHRAHLDVVTKPRHVHWDLWDTNVFVDPATLEVTGVIDFERTLWADPLMEAQFVGKRANDAATEQYGTPLFDEPYAVERRRLYDLYLYLVMFIECAYRNYETDDIEQLARACLDATIAELAED